MTKKLAKLSRLKKNENVLDIASNDGTLLNFYKKNIITWGVDPILEKYIELDQHPEKIISDGYNPETVYKVTKLVDKNEYKRRIIPPIKSKIFRFDHGRC